MDVKEATVHVTILNDSVVEKSTSIRPTKGYMVMVKSLPLQWSAEQLAMVKPPESFQPPQHGTSSGCPPSCRLVLARIRDKPKSMSFGV